MSKRVLKIIGGIVIGLITLSLIGILVTGLFFKKSIKTVFESATGSQVDFDEDGGEIQFKDKDGNSAEISTSTSSLPKDFPNFVPLYPGAKLLASSRHGLTEEGRAFSATYTTKDSAEQVYGYYEDKISSVNGYNVGNANQTSSGISSISGTHQETGSYISFSIMMDEETGGTTIQIGTQDRGQE